MTSSSIGRRLQKGGAEFHLTIRAIKAVIKPSLAVMNATANKMAAIIQNILRFDLAGFMEKS